VILQPAASLRKQTRSLSRVLMVSSCTYPTLPDGDAFERYTKPGDAQAWEVCKPAKIVARGFRVARVGGEVRAQKVLRGREL
jgi:hypothetical protein